MPFLFLVRIIEAPPSSYNRLCRKISTPLVFKNRSSQTSDPMLLFTPETGEGRDSRIQFNENH